MEFSVLKFTLLTLAMPILDEPKDKGGGEAPNLNSVDHTVP